MWRAAPSEPIHIILGTLSYLIDIINCAKFYLDRSRGFRASEKRMFASESEVVLNNTV